MNHSYPTYIIEEYIPLKIKFKDVIASATKLMFSKDGTSAFEVTVVADTFEILRMTLLLSTRYKVINACLEMPTHMISVDKLCYSGSDNNNCPRFDTLIYQNGVHVILSDEPSEKILKCDPVCIGVSNTGLLTEILLFEMDKTLISHHCCPATFQNSAS